MRLDQRFGLFIVAKPHGTEPVEALCADKSRELILAAPDRYPIGLGQIARRDFGPNDPGFGYLVSIAGQPLLESGNVVLMAKFPNFPQIHRRRRAPRTARNVGHLPIDREPALCNLPGLSRDRADGDGNHRPAYRPAHRQPPAWREKHDVRVQAPTIRQVIVDFARGPTRPCGQTCPRAARAITGADRGLSSEFHRSDTSPLHSTCT